MANTKLVLDAKDAVEHFLYLVNGGKYDPMEEVVLAIQRKACMNCAEDALDMITGYMEENHNGLFCGHYEAPFWAVVNDSNENIEVDYNEWPRTEIIDRYAGIGCLPPVGWEYHTTMVSVRFPRGNIGIYHEDPDGYRWEMRHHSPYQTTWSGNVTPEDARALELPLRVLAISMIMARMSGSYATTPMDPSRW